MATLIVDDREQTVSPFLAGKNVPFLIKRITTGDFCIVRQNPNNPAEDRILAVFERKSMNDFAASIKDGRYENYHNMIELQKENDGCQLYYIIECQKAFPAPDDRFDRIPYSNISAAINKLEIVYNIMFLKTKDPDDTAAKLAEKIRGYDKYWEEISPRYKSIIRPKPIWPAELVKILTLAFANPDADPEDIQRHSPAEYRVAEQAINEHIPGAFLYDYLYILKNKETHRLAGRVVMALAAANKEWDEYRPTKLMDTLTETKHKSVDEIKIRMWMAIPGVSWIIAPILKAKFTIKQFINKEISAEQLETVNYASGKKLHSSLVKTLTSGPDNKLEIDILQCIPNLGQKADALIKISRLAELIKLPADKLAEIKIGKTCLGPVKSAEILATIM
jgi:ERCC4-type nuclease